MMARSMTRSHGVAFRVDHLYPVNMVMLASYGGVVISVLFVPLVGKRKCVTHVEDVVNTNVYGVLVFDVRIAEGTIARN
jgi:hypothetical protein